MAEVCEEAVLGLDLGLGFWLRLHGCGGYWGPVGNFAADRECRSSEPY